MNFLERKVHKAIAYDFFRAKILKGYIALWFFSSKKFTRPYDFFQAKSSQSLVIFFQAKSSQGLMIFLERKFHKATIAHNSYDFFRAKSSQAKSYGFFWAKSSQGLVYKALALWFF